jgi:hypothetical protein
LKSVLAVCVVLLMFVPVGALAQNGPQTQTLASPSHTDLAVSGTIKTMDLQYSFSEPSIYYGLGYGGMTHIMSDLPKVHVPGLPAVPVQTKVIELPGDARVNDVKATVGHRSVAYLPKAPSRALRNPCSTRETGSLQTGSPTTSTGD